MEKIPFQQLAELLFEKTIAVEIDGYLTFPRFNGEPGEPFMEVLLDQTGEELDFHEDNNGEIEVVSRIPLVMNLLDTRGDIHEIIPLTFMEI
jgi:hypothetical protein